MSKEFDIFTDSDLLQIKALIEALEASTLDFLQIESGDIKLTLAKGLPIGPEEAKAAKTSIPPEGTSTPEPAKSDMPFPEARKARTITLDSGNTIPITAPMVGRFYARSEPGAQPFVTVGTMVVPDTTVGLLEVMKVFTSVSAGTSGTIDAICVEDGDYVEYAQILFRVRPTSSSNTQDIP